MVDKISLKKLDEKFNALPLKKKVMAVVLLSIIFLSLLFVVFSDKTKITTVTYPSGCVDIYINDELNSTNCSGILSRSTNKLEKDFFLNHNLTPFLEDVLDVNLTEDVII